MLTIAKSPAMIRTVPNARNEIHGDEIRQAIDLKLTLQVLEDAKTVIDGLHVPALQKSMWDKDGEPLLNEIDITLRSKIENVKVAFTQKTSTLTLKECDLKSVKLKGIAGGGVEIECTVQSLCNDDQFSKAWSMQIDGALSVLIEENQIEVDKAA